jgi:hypothetical protein
MQQKPPRPTGVTILGVLAILGGIAGLIGGVALISLGLLIGTLLASQIANQLTLAGYPGLAGLEAGLIGTIIIVIGVVALLMGILYLAVGIGFFGGKGWAWTLGMIVSVIGVVLAIAQIAFGNVGSVVSLIIGVLILYYLMRPHVKAFFGKGPLMGPMMGSGTMPGTAMGSTMGSSAGSTMMRCSHCGATVAPGTTKCPACGAAL